MGHLLARVQPAVAGVCTHSVQHSVSCLHVDIKRVFEVPYSHGTAALMRGHSALVKPSREQVFAEYAGQRHMLLRDGQITGETVKEQQYSNLRFEKVSSLTWATCSVTAVPLLKQVSTLPMSTLVQYS